MRPPHLCGIIKNVSFQSPKSSRAFIALIAVALIVAAVVASNRPPRPNVVLVVVDTLRADRLDAERDGVPLMPNLTAFAETATNFTNAVSQSTWTKPAMASLFTSTYFDVHNVRFSVDPEDPGGPVADTLAPDFHTLAEMLQDAGYRTFAIQTNPNLLAEFGYGQGFAQYQYKEDAKADWVTDSALEALDGLRSPFFLYVHYMDPHGPYEPPPDYQFPEVELSEDEQSLVDNFQDYFWDHVYHFLGMSEKRVYPELSEAARENVRRRYDGEVNFVDAELGRLLDHVEANYGDAVVVVVSDHGEEFWEHGSLGHGTTMFAEQLNVPFIAKGLNLPLGPDARLVETIDIFPTLAVHLGLTIRPEWQGLNLLEPLSRTARPAFSRTQAAWPRVKLDIEAVVHEDYKYIRDRRADEENLYHLIRDLGEQNDLAAEDLERVKDLRAILNERHERNQALVSQLGDTAGRTKIDPETLKQLESLGYYEPKK